MNLTSGAECDVSGTISVFADWNEDLYFYDPSDGSAMVLTGLTFKMQFRQDPSQTSADVTLTTSDYLSIVADEGSVNSILRIAAPDGHFSSYTGDMIVDLIAIDQSSEVIHYAHGVVTFVNDPITV